jgi:hypothetical protein
MIIGADLLSELGIEINFSTQRIIWEGIEIPMKDKHIISDLQNATAIYYSLCPKKMTPLDTSIRKKSGILSKRHIILVELNESYQCMNNIKCGRKSLYVHNRVFRQKNHRTSIVKRITRHCGHP